jgi:hypothetical protein
LYLRCALLDEFPGKMKQRNKRKSDKNVNIERGRISASFARVNNNPRSENFFLFFFLPLKKYFNYCLRVMEE